MKPQEQQGMFKKVRSARPLALWRAGRTHSTQARQSAENAADALFQHPQVEISHRKLK